MFKKSLTEAEFISVTRLAGQVAQDVFIPALVQRFRDKVSDVEMRLEKPIGELSRRFSEQEQEMEVLRTRLTVLQATCEMLVAKGIR